MSTLTTALFAWFLAFAGVDAAPECAAEDAPTTCPAGPPPPDASSGGKATTGPAPLPGPQPTVRPGKSDGIYNGI
jgi:hypothetical protein